MKLNRRSFLLHGAQAGAALSALPLSALAADTGKAAPLQQRRAVTIAAPSGAVRGAAEQGVLSFKGIPFAQPPVGALRFMPPQALPVASGVRNAFAFGPAPMQPDRVQAGSGRHFIGDAALSEDCLYLNVWAPETPGPHPVFVWVYGGSNIYGATSQPIYDGASFARNGVVCVTIGYRLGAFGFLELGEVLGEKYKGSGNNALRDQTMGLQWVHDNIAAFGGDPARVTLAGESAGGKNVSALLAAPAAAGLFNQSIIQSGGGLTTHTLAGAGEVARLLLETLQAGQPGVSAADLLLGVNADTLLKAQTATVARYPHNFAYRSVVDGVFLPRSPQEMVAQGASRDVRLLIGSNHDEALLFFPPALVAGYRKDPAAEAANNAAITSREMAQLDVPAITVAAERYRKAFPQQSGFERRVRLLTAEEYWIPTVRMADAHAQAGGVTYMYRFDETAKQGPFSGYAVHAGELPFTWRNFSEPFLEMLYGKAPPVPPLADLMHATWIEFIRSGRPRHRQLPAWPQYRVSAQTGGRATMLLNSSGSRMQDDPAGAERALWQDLM
ncbi:carboxylesterase family protein [Herbaspirillum lusitanum]|uniref:Carboxylic ester hydrolase n=1 Tax=Herbaspirillum lusitanum TaxID=213312 RepID=A0ABW9ADU5_9BURK